VLPIGSGVPEQTFCRPGIMLNRVVSPVGAMPCLKAICSRCVWGCRPMKEDGGPPPLSAPKMLFELSVIGHGHCRIVSGLSSITLNE